MTRRVVWSIMATLFVLCAAVQYNDPDPWVWILGYGAACVLSGAAATGRIWWRPAVALGLVYFVWGALWFSRVLRTRDWIGEEGRESMGLALAAIAMAVLTWIGLRRTGADGG